jgi:hypothetical protein
VDVRICKEFTCWTDYPILPLGDKSGQEAPVRQVKVLAYDHNKYVMVEVIGNGVITSFKAGYLYSKKGKYGQVPFVNRRKVERMNGANDYFHYIPLSSH